jgi:hypothetical protein
MNSLVTVSCHPFARNFIRAIRENGMDLLSYEITAIDNLVKDLVYYDIWNRLVSLYPFVGRNSIPHSFNLIDPRKFRITWAGTIIHDANGITPNGTNGTGNTGLNPAIITGFTNSLTFGVYSRTNGTSDGVDLGAENLTNLHIKYTDNNGYYDNNISSGRISVAMTTSLGLILSSRVSSSNHGGWQNGTKVIFGSGAQGGFTSTPFYIASRTGTQLWTSRNYSLCVIGYGLTDDQNRLLYESVQRFQVRLRRSV